MKRIAASLAVIALVVSVAVGATMAYFSDNTSNLTGITFSTGNADLRLTQVCSHQWFDGSVALSDFNNVYDGCKFVMNPEPYYPGLVKDNVATLYLVNASTANISLDTSIQLTSYTENVAGLQNVMEMKIWWNGNATGTDWHPLSYYVNSARSLITLDPPTSLKYLTFSLKMDPSADNTYAGASAGFNIHFNAEQHH